MMFGGMAILKICKLGQQDPISQLANIDFWIQHTEFPNQCVKVRQKEKIRNQIPHLTWDIIWESDKNTRKHHMFIVVPFCFVWEGVCLVLLSFVVHYLVSFLVLQSSRWGRETWMLYFNCLLMSFDC